MTREVMTGVATGADPPGGQSFGDVRSAAIHAALAGTARRGGDLAAFRTAARDRLREAGVDPDRPYDNQRPTYPAVPPRLAAAIRPDFRAGSADEAGEGDLSRLGGGPGVGGL